MRLSCKYNALMSALSSVSLIAEDALSHEDMKNIIFRLTPNSCHLVGINALVVYKKTIDPSTYSIEFDENDLGDNQVYYFSLKSKELMSFLGTFKTLNKTVADEVTFQSINGKIRTSVFELPKDAVSKDEPQDISMSGGVAITVQDSSVSAPAAPVENDVKPIVSYWMFDSLPIKPVYIPDIELVYKEDGGFTTKTDIIQFYVSTLLPILQTSGNSLYSKMFFTDEIVMVFNTAFTVLMSNGASNIFGDDKSAPSPLPPIPSVLKNLCLPYRVVSYLRDIISSTDEISINKMENDLRIGLSVDGDFSAFIKYEPKTAEYTPYLERFQKTNGLILDRLYFRDVLKRLSLTGDNIMFNFNVTGGVITVSNTRFTQDIVPLKVKGFEGITEIKFKIMPDVLNKAIIGDDRGIASDSTGGFDTMVFLYLTPTDKGDYILNIADSTGVWFSTANIR